MENISDFDVNAAFRLWVERLGQSPQFRNENLQELESHVRDSVSVLQSKGLSAEEAFLIGIRRVGSGAALEAEFAKENGGRGWHHMLKRVWNRFANRLIHLAVLLYFTAGCWFMWGVLKVGQMAANLEARAHASHVTPPAFTRLWLGLMPYWYIPPALALLYCGLVWTTKAGTRRSWFGFFAILTAMLFLLVLPVLIAAALPVIDFLNSQVVMQN